MDKFDAVKQYKELLEMGVISEEEFNAKKRELLGLPGEKVEEPEPVVTEPEPEPVEVTPEPAPIEPEPVPIVPETAPVPATPEPIAPADEPDTVTVDAASDPAPEPENPETKPHRNSPIRMVGSALCLVGFVVLLSVFAVLLVTAVSEGALFEDEEISGIIMGLIFVPLAAIATLLLAGWAGLGDPDAIKRRKTVGVICVIMAVALIASFIAAMLYFSGQHDKGLLDDDGVGIVILVTLVGYIAPSIILAISGISLMKKKHKSIDNN